MVLHRETSFHNSNLSVRFISTNGTYSFYPKTKYAELHTGYVSGSNQSFVLAHLEPYTSLLSAHIHMESDIFVIEVNYSILIIILSHCLITQAILEIILC